MNADHEVLFTSGAFTENARSVGLSPSFGFFASAGDALDNTMMESLGSLMRNELLDRKRWNTRIELSNAIFNYVQLF